MPQTITSVQIEVDLFGNARFLTAKMSGTQATAVFSRNDAIEESIVVRLMSSQAIQANRIAPKLAALRSSGFVTVRCRWL